METVKQYQADMAGLNTQRITSHSQLAKGVTATGYADGTVVYVNRNKTAYSAAGVEVPAESYVVERSAK